ncbi:MAG: SDR family oxidoreductase, partial [Myxococcota bacterium]
GWQVAAHYHSEAGAARAEALGRAWCTEGGTVQPIYADLRDMGAAAALAREAEDAVGPLGAVVYCAGVSGGSPLVACRHEQSREVLQINLVAAMIVVSESLRLMLPRRYGRVVALGSPTGSRGGQQGQGAYATSKAGLAGLVRTVANEYSPRGDFTANVVSPGFVPSPLTDAVVEMDGVAEQLKLATPLRRFGTAQEVASTVAFLLSDGATYINGADIPVDGGFSLKHLPRTRRIRRSS